MTSYCFNAPSLFDAAATASDSDTVYHDAPMTGEQLARHKRCAQWLTDQLTARGVRALGPDTDEGGWTITVSAKSGFVLIILDITKEGQPFQLLVTQIGSAVREIAEVEVVLKEILESSTHTISDLTIEDY